MRCDWERLAVSHNNYAGTALSAGVTRIPLWQEPFCQKLSAKFTENISHGDGADGKFTSHLCKNWRISITRARLTVSLNNAESTFEEHFHDLEARGFSYSKLCSFNKYKFSLYFPQISCRHAEIINMYL